MEKIRNLSLKRTIILYAAISLVCTFFLSAVTIRMTERIQQQIWWKYVNQDKYFQASNRGKENYEVSIPRPSRSRMDKRDYQISELCDFIETYSVLFLTILGSCIAVTIFYKNKLQKPIDELGEASKMIARDELDFRMTYENQDEMGILCKEFEKMRCQLEANNKKLWRMVEDEKALRAAIAHDIRSPLSVLKGYQEMLLEFIPEKALEEHKILEILQEGMQQIERMDVFIETMRKMFRLEERELHYTKVQVSKLKEQIQKEAEVLIRGSEKKCIISMPKNNREVVVDGELVMEVVENLLSNALRYAAKEVKIILVITDNELEIHVQDDGIGFQESEEVVTQAFYHANPQDDLKHFGMGMYISRIYCERHGGRLLVKNSPGGACVCAIFANHPL